MTKGLNHPLLVKAAPGDTTRLYVVQQGGTIGVVKGGALAATPFVNLASRLVTGSERGLLGFAFHPDFANNHRVFVHYSAKASTNPGLGLSDGDTVIAELTANDGDTANPASVKILLTVSQPESNHNGGSIEFGSDGKLYIGLGDGGGGGDNHGSIGNGQKQDTLLGKILRIDVDAAPASGKAYAIPAGNMTGGFFPEIWDYGVRNPYRFSFDACTGDLYIGEVGQDAWEEIDVEPAGSGNRNYGWRRKEGDACYNPSSNCDNGGLTDPVYAYSHNGGQAAVTGGYVYRGSAIPALRGTYFFGDYVTGQVWTGRWDGAGALVDVVERTADLGGFNVSSFGQDANGELYVVNYDGSVHRVDAQ